MTEVQDMGLEDGQVREEIGEASEQDMQAVQDNLKKAQQVWSQIQQTQGQNRKTAKMLSLLISNITHEGIFTKLYNFLVQDNTPVEDIFVLFLPFLHTQVIDSGLDKDFADYEIKLVENISQYSQFVKKALVKNQELSKLDQQQFIDLVKDIIYYYNIGDMGTMSKDEKSFQEIDEQLSSSLYQEFYQ